MLCEKDMQLVFQTFTEHTAVRCEVDIGRSVLGDFKQAVLNTQCRIFQAKIQCSSLLHRHSPNGVALSDRYGQP